jgi:glucosamine--fructose-6-phosphate aminotransferase (isomerizing)
MTRIPFAAGCAAQPAALERIAALVDERLDLPPRRRPLFCGIGASYAALEVPVRILRGLGVPAQRVTADELADHPAAFDTDAIVGVSQGGRSTETIAAFERVAELRPEPVDRIALVNVERSPLAELADLVVGLGDEPDSYASTIGFTGSLVALDLMAAAFAGAGGAYAKWKDIADRTEAVRHSAQAVLATIIDRASRCVAVDAVGSGMSVAAAEEGALLIREVPRVPSAASATRTYLHGEMESAGNTMHLVFGAGREVSMARTLAAAGHLTLLATTAAVDPQPNLSVVRLPESDDPVRVVLETVVAQELAAALAASRGVTAEEFVFANDDTKKGAVDSAGLPQS